ncbi:hypothetical protein N7530_010854 [Penicillium desertorum]|uniref:Uncharacterized protein n=1 Tax=Penicillium desertorum TaxID=1303715 RepID=A0A9W9WGJ5_9EURO|nr:hypothetical protein N7530_010854 [Penicillium desertorum]
MTLAAPAAVPADSPCQFYPTYGDCIQGEGQLCIASCTGASRRRLTNCLNQCPATANDACNAYCT